MNDISVTDLVNSVKPKPSIDGLRKILPQLAPHDQTFAKSLIDTYDKWGNLSMKQWPWVGKLMDKVAVTASASTTSAPAPAPATTNVEVGKMSSLMEMFDNAKSNGIQYPKIRIELDGMDLKLSLAGSSAMMPGSITVVCDDNWMGRITREGFYQPRRNIKDISSTLIKLAENPLEQAVAYGKRTGRCCLCNRTLTNKASIDAGIGPICASNFGLN